MRTSTMKMRANRKKTTKTRARATTRASDSWPAVAARYACLAVRSARASQASVAASVASSSPASADQIAIAKMPGTTV
jgi:hypothetical protein